MHPFEEVDQILADAISDGAFPGCAYSIGKLDGVRHANQLGRQTYSNESAEIDEATVWDLASVSKVVGTTTAFMIALERGKMDIQQPVSEILPEFGVNGKNRVTFENLLVHNSGLVAFRRYQLQFSTREEIWNAICNESLTYETGSQCVYSDLSMIVAAQAIERATSCPFNLFMSDNIWAPLSMTSTTTAPGIDNPSCAPTEAMEPWRKALRQLRGQSSDEEYIQGEVHDPTATVMGHRDATVGHAGLFSTPADLTTFAEMMLSGGNGIVTEPTIRKFTVKQRAQSTRALGWDTKSTEGSSAGTLFGPNSYGHTGYTGTSIWIDPDAKSYAILLTNRVHPTSENLKISQVRRKFHDAVFQALSLN